MASAPFPFPVYGTAQATLDGDTYYDSISITIVNKTHSGSGTTYTNASGKFTFNLSEIAENGDTIDATAKIQWKGNNYSVTTTFTFVITDMGKYLTFVIDEDDLQIKGDLKIYYSSQSGGEYTYYGWATRWDASNYSITVETYLPAIESKELVAALKPGAVGELYQILGRPYYYDKTWNGSNTLVITPIDHKGSTMPNMRSEKTVYVQNIVTHPVSRDQENEWISVSIEGFVSGSIA